MKINMQKGIRKLHVLLLIAFLATFIFGVTCSDSDDGYGPVEKNYRSNESDSDDGSDENESDGQKLPVAKPEKEENEGQEADNLKYKFEREEEQRKREAEAGVSDKKMEDLIQKIFNHLKLAADEKVAQDAADAKVAQDATDAAHRQLAADLKLAADRQELDDDEDDSFDQGEPMDLEEN